MDTFAELCRKMAEEKPALTFRQIAAAATKGAVVGQKAGGAHGAWIGAVLSVSGAALQRSEELLTKLETEQQEKKPKPAQQI